MSLLEIVIVSSIIMKAFLNVRQLNFANMFKNLIYICIGFYLYIQFIGNSYRHIINSSNIYARAKTNLSSECTFVRYIYYPEDTVNVQGEPEKRIPYFINYIHQRRSLHTSSSIILWYMTSQMTLAISNCSKYSIATFKSEITGWILLPQSSNLPIFKTYWMCCYLVITFRYPFFWLTLYT